ncbi:MAG: aldehyde dehydrogenase family protein [Phycisphaerales bacterium]|nr:aldehyde dehydrogenase family protein [Phycisphaerales bacterium]
MAERTAKQPTERLDVLKTYKLFIDGKFPRSESGRSMIIATAAGPVHLCRASRKDLRDAVEAARKAQPGWAAATAYNRGQVLYRMAEMLEGRKREFVEAIGTEEGTKARRHKGTKGKKAATKPTAELEVLTAIDRLVSYAGWADKYAQVLGCNNPVSGPFYNFTIPEPTGVVVAVAPDDAPLLGLISLIAPVLCAGNTVVALGSSTNPIPAAILGEVSATSDVPAGVLNILTGDRAELLPHIAGHRDIDGIHAAGLSGEERMLIRGGVAENLKRVRVWDNPDWFDAASCQSPWRIEPFVEMKTVWHPSAV